MSALPLKAEIFAKCCLRTFPAHHPALFGLICFLFGRVCSLNFRDRYVGQS